MALSLSPGPARATDAQFLAENANMWRVSDDFWDDWKLLRENFTLAGHLEWVRASRRLAGCRYAAPGPPRDSGHARIDRHSHFTPVEQRTVAQPVEHRAVPLIFGGDLPSNDDFTNSLLTNEEVLAVDQDRRARPRILPGRGSHRLDRRGARLEREVSRRVQRGREAGGPFASSGARSACPSLHAARPLGGEGYWSDPRWPLLRSRPHASGLYKLTAAK